jgi:hypothetical protein
MALAAAAHAQFNGMGSTSRVHDSQSANLFSKFINRQDSQDRERSHSNGDRQMIKNEPSDDEEMMDDEPVEKAENLSMNLSTRETPPTSINTPTPPPMIPHITESRSVIVPPMKYTSPRLEPSSTTPPSMIEQPLALDKPENNKNIADVAALPLTPTTIANYDE